MAKQFMLSTNDNPFNPFEDFHSWYSFDMEKGYDSCGTLDRIAHFSDEMTEVEINQETERAIDTIIEHDFMDVYIKVSKDLIDPDDNEDEIDDSNP